MTRPEMTATPNGPRRSLRRALLLAVALLPPLLSSCHEDHDDYYTAISVHIRLPEGYAAGKMQGTVRLTNLNNRQTYATSAFDGTTATLQVMRGVYAVDAEGSLRYTDVEGRTQTGNFRATSSYCEALEHPSAAEVDLVFM